MPRILSGRQEAVRSCVRVRKTGHYTQFLDMSKPPAVFINVYLFLGQRETEHERGRGREREGDTESETGSRLRAISPEPDAGLELTDREIVTWLKSDA